MHECILMPFSSKMCCSGALRHGRHLYILDHKDSLKSISILKKSLVSFVKTNKDSGVLWSRENCPPHSSLPVLREREIFDRVLVGIIKWYPSQDKKKLRLKSRSLPTKRSLDKQIEEIEKRDKTREEVCKWGNRSRYTSSFLEFWNRVGAPKPPKTRIHQRVQLPQVLKPWGKFTS